MTKPKRVIITGAHSPLGAATLQALQECTDCHAVALVTPWHDRSMASGTEDRVTVLEQDLLLPLSEAVASEIAGADILLHFAWFRDADVHTATAGNKLVIRQLLELLPSPNRFVFISSVGASAGTMSAYGTAKWEVAQIVKNQGGLVLVCGLVTSDPPFGPHAILTRWAHGLWIRPRFFAPHVSVYLTPLARVGATAVMLTTRSVPRGVYRLFDIPPSNLNVILGTLEGKAELLRPLLPIPTGLLLRIARALKDLRIVPTNFMDKILTFLYKDCSYLDSLAPIFDGD